MLEFENNITLRQVSSIDLKADEFVIVRGGELAAAPIQAFPQGEKGDQGLRGETGPQGPHGQQGSPGPSGPQGLQGPSGAQGEKGEQGPAGIPGPSGSPGTAGPQGSPGDPGQGGIQWQGLWNSSTTYQVEDAVAFNGSSYVCTATSRNIRPPGRTWDVLAKQGDSGGGGGGAKSEIVTITFIIDGGGDPITTGIKGDLEIPFECTINRVIALADQSGSIVVDIWKDTYDNFPPTDADSITDATPITIAATNKSKDSQLINWRKLVSEGDILRFNVDSASTITKVTLSIKVTKT